MTRLMPCVTSRKQARQAIERAAKGEFVQFETTLTNAEDGDIRYVDFSIKPVINEDNEIMYLVPEGRDITQYLLSELRFKTLFETAGYSL